MIILKTKYKNLSPWFLVSNLRVYPFVPPQKLGVSQRLHTRDFFFQCDLYRCFAMPHERSSVVYIADQQRKNFTKQWKRTFALRDVPIAYSDSPTRVSYSWPKDHLKTFVLSATFNVLVIVCGHKLVLFSHSKKKYQKYFQHPKKISKKKNSKVSPFGPKCHLYDTNMTLSLGKLSPFKTTFQFKNYFLFTQTVTLLAIFWTPQSPYDFCYVEKINFDDFFGCREIRLS